MKQIILNFNEIQNLDIDVQEDTEIIGVCKLINNQELKSIINVIHSKPNLRSLTTIKAIVYDNANFDCEGKLVINKGAFNTDAYLRIDVLIIGDNGKARAVPSLEITENNVKGGHGATVGRIDIEQIFYLQSKGLSKIEAEKLIIDAFLDEIINKINDTEVQNKIRLLISKDA